MNTSDQLARLSARAREAEDRAAAAGGKAKADLEDDVASARASAQQHADQLHATAVESKGKISDWWTDVQDTWHAHVAERDAAEAERRAENAESDALFAIDFAYSAIQEAEYAVLDAHLARMESDELATSSEATA
jgi:hypothetical protein